MKPRQPKSVEFDLMISENAYIFGLLQTDGHMRKDTRNRGRIEIEIVTSDADILDRVETFIPVKTSRTNRSMVTNFSNKNNYNSSSLRIFDWGFRNLVEEYGIPYGVKSDSINIPTVPYSEIDYWRGIIDGDGSLGITATGIPYLSLVTKSEKLSKSYLSFIEKILGFRKKSERNIRDNVYNISLFKEDAQKLITALYYRNCLAITRKIKKSQEVQSWRRPLNQRVKYRTKKWTAEEDDFILTHSLNESISKLGRTEKSVVMRLIRIKNSFKY